MVGFGLHLPRAQVRHHPVRPPTVPHKVLHDKEVVEGGGAGALEPLPCPVIPEIVLVLGCGGQAGASAPSTP